VHKYRVALRIAKPSTSTRVVMNRDLPMPLDGYSDLDPSTHVAVAEWADTITPFFDVSISWQDDGTGLAEVQFYVDAEAQAKAKFVFQFQLMVNNVPVDGPVRSQPFELHLRHERNQPPCPPKEVLTYIAGQDVTMGAPNVILGVVEARGKYVRLDMVLRDRAACQNAKLRVTLMSSPSLQPFGSAVLCYPKPAKKDKKEEVQGSVLLKRKAENGEGSIKRARADDLKVLHAKCTAADVKEAADELRNLPADNEERMEFEALMAATVKAFNLQRRQVRAQPPATSQVATTDNGQGEGITTEAELETLEAIALSFFEDFDDFNAAFEDVDGATHRSLGAVAPPAAPVMRSLGAAAPPAASVMRSLGAVAPAMGESSSLQKAKAMLIAIKEALLAL